MPEITYALLKPIIVKEQLGEHNMMQLEFKTEDMAEPLQTVAVVVPDQDELIKNAMLMAGKSAAANAVVSGLAGMLGGTLGTVVGQAGSHVAAAAAGNPANLLGGAASDEKKQQAIVTAFLGIQQFFRFDEAEGKWHAAN